MKMPAYFEPELKRFKSEFDSINKEGKVLSDKIEELDKLKTEYTTVHLELVNKLEDIKKQEGFFYERLSKDTKLGVDEIKTKILESIR